MQKYVTALTWGHANKKLFLATGQQIHVATVQRTVPTLQALCRQTIAQAIGNREASLDLNLPSRMKTNIIDTFQSAIQVSLVCKSSVRQHFSIALTNNPIVVCGRLSLG